MYQMKQFNRLRCCLISVLYNNYISMVPGLVTLEIKPDVGTTTNKCEEECNRIITLPDKCSVGVHG